MVVAASYKIEVDGRDITSKLRSERRLTSIEVTDREGEASDSCQLELDDRPPHVEWPPAGAKLRVWLGETDDTRTDCGTYTLDAPQASSPPDRLSVSGHAAAFLTEADSLPMNAERTRRWDAVSLGDMVQTIASDHGLVARVQPSLEGEIVGNLEQLDESDLALITRIAQRHGARARVKAGALEVVESGPLTQLPSYVLTPRNVEHWSAPLGGRLQPGTVVARWHNPKTGQSGVKTAGDAEPVLVLQQQFETPQSAASAAKSRIKDGEREAAQLQMRLDHMNTRIVTGTEISLSEFRSEIDTIWKTTEARHRARGDSARTTLVLERSVS